MVVKKKLNTKTHGGDISPLLQGGHDNMVSSITTLGTPHNGTHAADELEMKHLFVKWF